MELKLEKKSIAILDEILNTSVIEEEETEIIVPDSSPDIMRIISSSAMVFIREKSVRDGRVTIEGAIRGRVLYCSSDDKAVRKLDVNLHFGHSFDDRRITATMEACASARLKSFDSRELNPRKISARAVVEVCVQAYAPTELSFATGVSDADMYGICSLSRSNNLYAPTAIREKSFVIADDISLPEASQMTNILSYDVNLVETDRKIIGNKAILKGLAKVNYIYSASGEQIGADELELQFSQIIDTDGVNESCDLRITLGIRDVKIEPVYDISGAAQSIGVNISALACAVAYTSYEAEALSDIYSMRHPTDIKYSDINMRELIENSDKRVSVSQTVETSGDVKQVCTARVIPGQLCRKNDTTVCELTIIVMYIGADGAVYCASKKADADCKIELAPDSDYAFSAQVSGIGAQIADSSGITVRFSVDINLIVTKSLKMRDVDSVELDEETSFDKSDVPSVTVRYVENEESMWSMAKKYRSSATDIAAANALDEKKPIPAGSMILIPRGA